jgi:hypothetical protein
MMSSQPISSPVSSKMQKRRLRRHPVAAGGDRGARAAVVLDGDGMDRTAAVRHHPGQPVAVEAFAAQADQQHRADIRMGAEPFHHLLRVRIRVAARKADHMRRRIGAGDLAGDVMGAFDQIGHRHQVADALAPVRARPAAHASHGRPSSA